MAGEIAPADERSVAVIGGGWAGCAAAVALSRHDLQVVVYETAAVLGGRARRVVVDDMPLDNGQHLLLGAYTQARAVATIVHRESAVPWRMETLALAPLSAAQTNALALRARALPAPFGLLAGLLGARGLSLAERLAAARWFARLKRRGFRCPPGQCVAAMLADGPPRAAERLWTPLCIAALNTPPLRASAQVFANVLRAAFDGTRDAADVVRPATDLSALLPDAAQQWLEHAGHAVHVRSPASILEMDAHGVRIRAGAREVRHAAALVAVGPHQLAGVVAPELAARDPRLARALALVADLAYEPIVTVFLGYRGTVSLPSGIVRLDDMPGQWVFDRADILARAGPAAPAIDQMLAVIISAHGPHESLTHPALAEAVDAQLRRLVPRWPKLAWSQVIAEQRATYACTPAATRPVAGAVADRLFLAGDYTDTEFPATLEAAVRSGVVAAAAIAVELARPRRDWDLATQAPIPSAQRPTDCASTAAAPGSTPAP